MRATSLLLVLTAACGRLSFDSPPAGDAGFVGLPDGTQADAPMKIAAGCGATRVFADDFADTMPGPLFQCDSDTGVTCAESGDNLDIVFTPPVPMYRFAFYTSVSTHAVTGLCVTLDISTLPSEDAAVFYKVRGFREAEFIIASTFVGMRTQTSDVVDTNSYSEVAPNAAWRYWRLRSQNSNAYWDVSADGVTFFELRETTGLFASSGNAAVVVGAGTIRDTTTATVARFARIDATRP